MTPPAPGHRGEEAKAAVVGSLVAWTFGLAPPILFVLTWSEDFSPLQQLARGYALPVLAAQVAIIAASFIEGFRLGRLQWVPLALLGLLVVHAWIGALGSTLMVQSLLRTGIWTVQVIFAFAIVNLWQHRMLDLEQFRTAILMGFLLVVAMFVAFVATTEHPPRGLAFKLPAFGHLRWYGYYAAAVMGLCAPRLLRGDKLAFLAATIAFAAAFWTGSRGPLAAALGGLVLSAILLRELRSVRGWILFALCGAAGLASALALDALVSYPTQGPGRMLNAENGARLEAWKDTIGAILQRPWLGWGEGQFREIFRDVWPFAQPHNVVLQVLLAWGLLGGLLCAALAAWAAPRFLRARSAEAAPFQCAVLMLAAYSFIDGSLYYAHSLALFFFCCAAAIAVGMPRGPAGSGEEPSLLQTESER